MKKIIPAVKGTRDFYPEIMAVRTWLYDTLRQVSESFGYQEYEAPILETIDLYAAKSGEELVKKQSYVFPDRGGDLITLRPELTPSLARMVAQKQRQLQYPLRWWSYGPFWRYERPQKGRTREFFQWNVDLIGIDSPEADAELVAVVASFFKTVGIKPDDAQILVNDRRLMDAELLALGVSTENRLDVFNLIDRRLKMDPAEWEAYAYEIGLDKNQLAGLKRLLEDRELWRKSPALVRFFNVIKALGIQEYVTFDPNTIRGLLYYTGTIFEAYEVGGEFRRSILGGGRYDNLMADIGGDPLPAVGFAMGDVTISLILESLGLLPAGIGASPAPVLVTVFNQDHLLASFSLANELRQAGIKVACYPEGARLQKQLKYADRMGMRVAILLGPDELAQDRVTVKDLASGDQKTVERDAAPTTILDLLNSSVRS